MKGWLLDRSAAVRVSDPVVGTALAELAGALCLCQTALLEQLFSTRSAADHDETEAALRAETALCHGLGVVHVDNDYDYDKIAQVRPLVSRRLG